MTPISCALQEDRHVKSPESDQDNAGNANDGAAALASGSAASSALGGTAPGLLPDMVDDHHMGFASSRTGPAARTQSTNSVSVGSYFGAKGVERKIHPCAAAMARQFDEADLAAVASFRAAQLPTAPQTPPVLDSAAGAKAGGDAENTNCTVGGGAALNSNNISFDDVDESALLEMDLSAVGTGSEAGAHAGGDVLLSSAMEDSVDSPAAALAQSVQRSAESTNCTVGGGAPSNSFYELDDAALWEVDLPAAGRHDSSVASIVYRLGKLPYKLLIF